MTDLTQERLKELLNYNPETGHFTRLVKTCNKVKVGDIAGSINHGYIIIRINKKDYQAHRLAFLSMTGKFPEKGLEVDHINQKKDDNRWINLRIVTHQENGRNQSMSKRNKSGYTGVQLHKSKDKYQSYIRIDGKQKHLGYFDNLDDAIASRKAAEIKYVYHTNHGQQTKDGDGNEEE